MKKTISHALWAFTLSTFAATACNSNKDDSKAAPNVTANAESPTGGEGRTETVDKKMDSKAVGNGTKTPSPEKSEAPMPAEMSVDSAARPKWSTGRRAVRDEAASDAYSPTADSE